MQKGKAAIQNEAKPVKVCRLEASLRLASSVLRLLQNKTCH